MTSNRRHAAAESGTNVEPLRPGAEDVINWVLRWQGFLGSVAIHLEWMTAAARWMKAEKH
jgi:hypothetical protein